MKRVIGKKSSMTPSVPLIRDDRMDSQDEVYKHLGKIFSAGSSLDALKIFYAAKNGIESSTQVIRELGLTQKRYYTNLKRLIDVGLVEKADDKYKHTTFGKIAYQLIEALKGALEQKDKLDLIDRLLKTKNLTAEEIEEIMRTILKDTNLIPGGRITDILGPVRMADTWEKLVNDVVEQIEKAEREIFFASKYHEMRTSEALLKAVQRGVEVYLLVDKEINIPKTIRMIVSLLFTSPKALRAFINLLRSPRFRMKKYENLLYSFMVVDGEYSMVEILTPIEKTFSVAFLFYNKTVSKKFSDVFKKLWEMGSNIESIDKVKSGDYIP